MSYWNYRILVREYEEENVFSIHEVHYENNDKPILHSVDGINPQGDSIKNLKMDISLMKKAFKKPILYYGEKFPQEYELIGISNKSIEN